MKITNIPQAYDNISAEYVIQSEEFNKFFENILMETQVLLPRSSKILDVGSGPGTPAAFYFANEGHSVTGIDIAPGMIEIARKKVPEAKFIQVENMTVYQPAQLEEYDAIVASQSLYHLSSSQLKSMVLKFSLWLKKGGFLLISHTIDQQLLREGRILFDYRGWSEVSSGTFLGETMDLFYGTPEAWNRLITETGFNVVRAEENYKDIPHEGIARGYHGLYIVARRVEENPLLGPFPIPERILNPLPLYFAAWQQILQKLSGDALELKKFLEGKKFSRVLCLGSSDFTLEILKPHSNDIKSISLEDLVANMDNVNIPVPLGDEGPIDLVVLSWTLSFSSSPEIFLQKLVQQYPSATIVLIQGAPDSEFFGLVNDAFTSPEMLKYGKSQHHEGVLLQVSEKVLKHAGFTNLTFHPLSLSLTFDSVPSSDMVSRVSALFASMYQDDPSALESVLGAQLRPLLTELFGTTPNEIGFQSVLLVAEKR